MIVEKLAITIEEMAEMLAIGKTKAYEIARRDDFYPAVRITERRIIINLQALKQWLEEKGRGGI